MPDEYRCITDRLFSADGFDIKTAVDFAEVLGVGTEYQKALSLNSGSEEMKVFLEHFQNNLELLIEKTWVEQIEEKRKQKLQDEAPSLLVSIKDGNFPKAIDEFNIILDELAYLFFGEQSENEDFTEYTFRIDDQMGLFWWYGSRLSSLKNSILCKTPPLAKAAPGCKDTDKILWALLLLGICYLTNF